MSTSSIGLPLVILAVSDLERSASFYEKALDLTWVVHVPVYREAELKGGMRFGLYEREAFAGNTGVVPAAPAPGGLSGAELYLEPEDFPRAVETFKAAGADMLAEPEKKPWGDEVAYFRDPDGHTLALFRHLGEEG